MKDNLNLVLSECAKSARIGYRIASREEKELSRTLLTAEEKIKNALMGFNSSPFYSPEGTSTLEEQLFAIEQDFSNLSSSFREKLEDLREKMSVFSIVLFGRTMTGKSTLMEVLIEGSGETIGKGSQRTTRDVRHYTWNGLEIKDVPGVGALNGEEDEQIALEAARTADLVLLLITDDAPQPVDAKFFSRIVCLGKPIICVMNVKVAVGEGKSIKLAQRDIEKKFEKQRLELIRSQFLDYSKQYGQAWENIPFAYVHLKSAFLAQQSSEPNEAEMYKSLSRIDDLKEKIAELVKTKGEFIRIKTFVDFVSNPLLESIESLLSQSQINSVQVQTILSKKKQLNNWKKKFYRESKDSINLLITTVKSDLNTEILTFAEEHFADKQADAEWKKLLEDRRVVNQSEELLEALADRLNDRLGEFSREVTNELNFGVSFAGENTLKIRKITDARKIWDWSSIAVGGGLTIAYGICSFIGAAAAGPLGWGALAASGIGAIGSYFLKSRDEKEDEAITRLKSYLKERVSKLCDSLQNQLEQNLEKLISIRIDGLLKEMDRVKSIVIGLANTQRKLAWGLNKHLNDLNTQIVNEALRIGGVNLDFQVRTVARIPGNTSIIVLQDGVAFPEEMQNQLHRLMSEQIRFVHETENKILLISKVLGSRIDIGDISAEGRKGIVHIPLDNVDADLINRARLAQQLSGMQIVNR